MINKDRLIDRVCSVCDADRTLLSEDFDCVVRELCAQYGQKYVLTNAGGNEVFDEYESAIASALLYTARGQSEDRTLFLERAGKAFVSCWRKRAYERKRAAG